MFLLRLHELDCNYCRGHLSGSSAFLTGTDSDLGHHDASELSGHSLADHLNSR